MTSEADLTCATQQNIRVFWFCRGGDPLDDGYCWSFKAHGFEYREHHEHKPKAWEMDAFKAKALREIDRAMERQPSLARSFTRPLQDHSAKPKRAG